MLMNWQQFFIINENIGSNIFARKVKEECNNDFHEKKR